jgi:hypothetical protein
MDPAYQRYLSSIVPYECTGPRSQVARVILTIFNLPMLLAFAWMLRRNKGKPIEKRTPPSYWLAWYFDKASRFSNAAHDYLVSPILGSGRCSTVERQILTRTKIQETLALEDRQKEMERQAEEEPEVIRMVEQVVETTAP